MSYIININILWIEYLGIGIWKHTAWKQECSFRNYFSLFYRYIYEHKFQQAISHPINNTLAKCLSGFQAHQTSVLFPRWESLEHNIVVKVGRSQETTPISKQYFIITGTLEKLVTMLAFANCQLYRVSVRKSIVLFIKKKSKTSHFLILEFLNSAMSDR